MLRVSLSRVRPLALGLRKGPDSLIDCIPGSTQDLFYSATLNFFGKEAQERQGLFPFTPIIHAVSMIIP